MDIDLEEDDLDFDEDKIKQFLLHKLQEIEVYNAKTKEMIDTRKQSYNNDFINNTSCEKNNSDAHVSLAWKKIYNNKYIIGFIIKNERKRYLDKITVLLHWNSSTALNYKTLIYDDCNLSGPCNDNKCNKIWNLRESNTIKTGYCVIVMEVPAFIDQTTYQLQGSIICQQEDQQVNISMPVVEISTTDATNRALYESEGTLEDLLSVITSSEGTKLLLVLPIERTKNLDSTFEIHCSLTKMFTFETCKSYFIANRLSSLFDGSLLEIHTPCNEYPEILFSTIYARNEVTLLTFLHHIYQNIQGIIVIPESLQQNYLMYRSKEDSMYNSEDTISFFKESAIKEMNLVQLFLTEQENNTSIDKNTVIKFKSQLADLEKDTDFLYLHTNK